MIIALSGSCLWAPQGDLAEESCGRGSLAQGQYSSLGNAPSHLISGLGEQFGTGILDLETADSTACLFSKQYRAGAGHKCELGY